jgi:hypothetical protein
MITKPENTFELKTKRLIIRPLNESDYEIWKEAYTNLLPPKNIWDMANKKSSKLGKMDFRKLLNM